jgi:short-subunit dehydrogenase
VNGSPHELNGLIKSSIMELKNKTAIVTGGNSGLGLQIVKELKKKKCRVIVVGRKNSDLICDLRDYKQIKALEKKIDKVDILINCAGIGAHQKLEEHDPENVEDIIKTNLLGTIYMTQLILPKMISQNSGTILNVSSTSGLMTGGYGSESVYMASKYGVSGFSEGLKKEMEAEKNNIKVIGFYPGGMKTEFFSKNGQEKDTSSFMDPNEIAKIIVFILERPDSINIDHIVINRNKNIVK